MRSKYIQEILDRTSPETHIYVQKYAEIVLRIHEILESKGWTQSDLAEKMGKQPSEVSRWLSTGQNLTLRSLAKLEHELGEEIIQVPLSNKPARELPKQQLPSINLPERKERLPWNPLNHRVFDKQPAQRPKHMEVQFA